MKLCMSMWSFQELIYSKKMDVKGFAQYCSENKIEYAELLDFFVEDNLDECLAILKEYNIKPAVWSICNDFVQPNAQKQQEQIDYVCKEIDIAASMGAPLLRIFSGDAKEISDGVPFPIEAGTESIKACLIPCAEYAKQKGVTLCMENHGVFTATSSQVKNILEPVLSLVPNALRSNFDTANFLFVDEDPIAAANQLKGMVSLLHLKDYALSKNDGEGWASEFKKIWYSGCPLGKGVVDIVKIIEILELAGFDGYASIELESPEPIEAADESLKFLHEVVGIN